MTSLKNYGLKVLIALGGWNDSAGNKYSRLVNDAAARKRFIDSVITFIENHNFDGLDLDWEYPVCWQVTLNTRNKYFRLTQTISLNFGTLRFFC